MTFNAAPATAAVVTLWTEIQTFILAQASLVLTVLAIVGVVFFLFREARGILYGEFDDDGPSESDNFTGWSVPFAGPESSVFERYENGKLVETKEVKGHKAATAFARGHGIDVI